MRLTPQQKVTAAFITAAAISVVIGVLAFWSASRMRNAAVLMARNQQVVSTLEGMFRINDDLSTDERDYVLTGNDAYLKAYKQGITSAGATIRRAQDLTAGDRSEQRRLQLISDLAGQFDSFSARVLRVRRVLGVSPAAELVLSGTGESLQHAINANVGAIIAREHRRLARRQLQMTHDSDTALYFILAGSALAVLIGLVASLRIRGDFRAIQQAEERFRALMDSAPDAMVVVDGTGHIVLVNARTESLFGCNRQKLIGQPIKVLIPTGYCARQAARPDTQGVAPRLMDASVELLARRCDGSEFPVEVSSSPVTMPGGRHIASAIRDISDRKRSLEELREARAEAERADRAKSTFLATASHDLRQPLQTISLLNGVLRRMITDNGPGKALVQQEAAIGVMSHLLNALLDISKLESGAVKPVVTDWQASALFTQLRGEFASLAANKGVQLEVDGSSVWVRSDLALVGQVLRNLLSNAIKYTHQGSVRLSARTEEEGVRIEVSDTGIGMAEQEIGHIYEEFYQIGVPTNATREGYGLGLSIVSRIVKLLDLGLEVHSQVGRGTTFVLKLPAGTVAAAPDSRAGVKSAAERSAKSAQHVLVVDDEPAVLDATRLLLMAEGYRVSTASSVAQALERMHESRDLALVITDYHLADGETGRQVIASVRQLGGPEVRAVLITGDTSAAARGFDEDHNLHFLSKPVEPDQLLGLLKELLALRTPVPEQA